MSNLSPLFTHPPSPLERLQAPILRRAEVALYIKRDDLLRMGPGLALCGNKWRKLQYNLQRARAQKHHRLLTFGGAFSNHIAAVAAAGQEFGFETIGIIRGERPEELNPTLRQAEYCGMQLSFISRRDYRQKQEAEFLRQLDATFAPFYLLPEGGSNPFALPGCRAIVQEVEQQLGVPPDYYCLSVGSGGTMAGVIRGAGERSSVLGFSALKGDFLQREVARILEASQPGTCPASWSIQTDYHFGGYARYQPDLIRFIHQFYQTHGIVLDPIYTGKMVYGLMDQIERGAFARDSRIVAIHTGGLQGIAGFNQRFKKQLPLP